jgi:hypothetical protein
MLRVRRVAAAEGVDAASIRDQLEEDFEPLPIEVRRPDADPGRVAAGTRD